MGDKVKEELAGEKEPIDGGPYLETPKEERVSLDMDTLNTIVNYLASRPYRESAELLNRIQAKAIKL